MTSAPASRLASLLLPEGLVLLAAALLLRWAPAAPAIEASAGWYALGALGVALALGLRLRRARYVFAVAVLGLAAAAVGLAPPGPATSDAAVFQGVALLLPLNVLALARAAERGVLTPPAARRWAFLALQVAVIALLTGSPEAAARLTTTVLPAPWLGSSTLGQPAWAAFALATVALGTRVLRRPDPLDRGLLWALLAALAALHAGAEAHGTVYWGTGGLILAIALIEASHSLAYRDGLTGLPARRALDEALRRLTGPYTIAMVDVDHFKRFNDRHGHAVGDQVLRLVGARLADVGAGARAFRYGGEEFAVLFPGTRVTDAKPHLERLRAAVAETAFTLRGAKRPRRKPRAPKRNGRRRRKDVSVTVSIGAAQANGRRGDPDKVVEAADRALYRAKKAGRNRVETSR